LKQASRTWNETLNNVLIKNNFERSKIDNCLYKSTSKEKLYVLFYVDDILIISPCDAFIKEIKLFFNNIFKMKDYGKVKTILGLNLKRLNDEQLHIDQERIINNLLGIHEMLQSKRVETPLEVGI